MAVKLCDNLDGLQCLVVLLQSKDTAGLAPYYNDKCHCLKSKVKEDMDNLQFRPAVTLDSVYYSQVLLTITDRKGFRAF